MSWRFRKTFKIMPGLKLNLTPRGLSATIGASPFSVNIGPRGVYRNVGIPGTGLWTRDRLDIPSSQRSGYQPQPTHEDPIPPPHPHNPSPPLLSAPSAATEIRSASTEQLTSQSMDDLRKLLKEAYEERESLTQEISKCEQESAIAARRYQNWERGFLLQKLLKNSGLLIPIFLLDKAICFLIP